MKGKRKKYNNGGNVRHYIETPDEAMREYDISLIRAQQKAESNGWAQGLNMFGNLAMQYGMNKAGGLDGVLKGAGEGLGITGGQEAAMGGKVQGAIPVEVEGEEIAETPNGEVVEFQGPSHENGGIDVDLPNGTDIFSKRVKGPDGKTMAQRKKKRENKENKISKLFDESPTDKLLKKTLERTKSNNMVTEEKDKKKMQMVRMLLGAREQFAFGGTTGEFPFPIIDQSLIDMLSGNIVGDISGTSDDYHTGDNSLDYRSSKTSAPTTSTPGIVTDGESGGKFNAFVNKLFGGEEGGAGINLTGGDLLSMYGQYKAGTDPLKNTLKQRAGDTPNINAFKDFGNDALDVNEETQGYIAGQRDNALKDVDRATVGAKNRNRNTARGVNTMRGLDLAVDMAGNQSREKLYDNFARQMMQVLGQKSQLENQQDTRVMMGEDERDTRDRKDIDEFYSQMAEDLATKNLMTQHMGKNINNIKQRQVTQNLMDQLSEHGLTIDSSGRVVGMTE